MPSMRSTFTSLLTLLTVCACSGGGDEEPVATPAVDGHIESGLRVLTFDPVATDQSFTVYRGDYVRPETPDGQPFVLEIPSLEIRLTMPPAEGQRSYFKLPDAGDFAFTLGEASGVIHAIEYEAGAYQEVSAREADALITSIHPLVLDVRTPGEFAGGHLPGAALIPVQELQSRLDELAAYRDETIFIYCASGNRSTVAAKLLIDAGHHRIVNLRHGIKEWVGDGLPVVKTPPVDHRAGN